MDESTLFYLYGVIPRDTPVPGALRGIDERPVLGVDAGRVRALVSEVDRAEYGSERLEARMSDLAWVAERAAMHERILLGFLPEVPVVPTGVFSLHADRDALVARLREREGALERLLERVADRAEWTVRIWLYPRRLEAVLESYSPEAVALAEEAERAGPGRRYLLERKRARLLDDAVERARRREVDAVLDRLEPLAVEVARSRVPGRGGEGERRLVGQAALLLDRSRTGEVRDEIDRLRARWRAEEIEVETSGPWPPYHFVGEGDGNGG